MEKKNNIYDNCSLTQTGLHSTNVNVLQPPISKATFCGDQVNAEEAHQE